MNGIVNVRSAVPTNPEAFGLADLQILALLDESVQRLIVAWLSLEKWLASGLSPILPEDSLAGLAQGI